MVVKISFRLILEHGQDVNGLFRRREIIFGFLGDGIREVAEMIEDRRTQRKDEVQEIHLGQELAFLFRRFAWGRFCPLFLGSLRWGFRFRLFLLTLFGVGILFLAPWTAWELLTTGVPTITIGAAGAILYIGLGASLASYAMWNSAVASIGPSLAGLIYYSLPLFSGVTAFLFLGEPMGLIHLLSAGCILGGIVLATRR